MGKTWFTSDTHFGHANIIRYCARPFADAREMDAALVANWNALVQPGDTVWHLGDFAYRSARPPGELLRRLSGTKHLLWGNHDGEETRAHRGWASSQPYAELSVEGERLVLCHYAFHTWKGAGRGALHLFGHSHGRMPGNAQSCDVGVDAWDYRPVGLAEIKRRLQTLPSMVHEDHHGPGRDERTVIVP